MTSSLSAISSLLQTGEPESRTDTRIMDVTRELFVESGTNLKIDELVERSGVSRATIFRRFGSKDALIERTFQREIRTGFVEIVSSAATRPTATERAVELVVASFLTCVRHPLIRHLAESNPPALSRLGSTGDPSPLAMVAQFMSDALLLASAEIGGPLPLPLDHAVDILIHVVAGYTYFPYGALADEADDVIRSSVEVLVRRLLPEDVRS
jgi:AcrR family transcriptional regulator